MANWANWFQRPKWRDMYYFMPFGPIGSTGLIGVICPNELMPIGPIVSIGPIGAKCPIVANWANWFHGPIWRDMYYVCQLGQLVPRAQLVRYVSMNYCLMGQLVPSAQLAPYVLFMPIGPIGSMGLIGAMTSNELMPIVTIGSIGPIDAICPIVANWANLFHGPNRRDMYYECQLGQLVTRAQLVR